MLTATRHIEHTRTQNDEIIRLIEAYQDRGDRRAIERILTLHGRILNSLFRRYANSSGEPYEDLLQVGYVGLIKAVNGYKMDSGAKFSSYAYAMVDGESGTTSATQNSSRSPARRAACTPGCPRQICGSPPSSAGRRWSRR